MSLSLRLANESADAKEALAKAGEAHREMEAKLQSEISDLQGNLAIQKNLAARDAENAAGMHNALEREKAAAEGNLRGQLRKLQADKDEMEEKLNERYKRLEALKLQETTLLRARVDRLSKLQDAAMNAGGAKARSLLYMENMRSKMRDKDSTSWRGEFEGKEEGDAEGEAGGVGGGGGGGGGGMLKHVLMAAATAAVVNGDADDLPPSS